MKSNMLDNKKLIYSSFIKASPICLGYIPLGMACGILGAKVGLTYIQICIMSILVFAGSAQFIAISMIASGATPYSIIVATFIVNLRHLLLSSTLSKYIKASHIYKILFAHGITDETFAINFNCFKTSSWSLKQAFLVNVVACITWASSNTLGGIIGPKLSIQTELFSYSLTAMFIALLSFQLKHKLFYIVALISGLLSVLLSFVLPGNLNIIAATLIAVSVGFIIDMRHKNLCINSN